MDSPTVSGVMTIRDGIEAGYPFVEAICSALPLVDELLVNDGGSSDGTREALDRLADTYEPVTVYEMPDYESEGWEVIDDHLESLIAEAAGDWLLEAQGDEIWRPADYDQIRELIAYADREGYRSIRQPRLNYSGFKLRDNYLYRTVRLVKNVPDLRSNEGGDDFRVGTPPYSQPPDYTTHHVPPELETNLPFYHYHEGFPEQEVTKHRRHAEHLATESDVRQEVYERYATSDHR